jgi:hypothetical protein
LEINVVYPALAAVYTLAVARSHFRKVLPMFVPSAAYLWLHQHLAPAAATGSYGVYFDGRLPATLWRYWEWALGPALMEQGRLLPGWSVPIATALLSGALLGFTVWKLRQHQWVAVFPLAWFLMVIAPVLPLREHVSDYYLTVPLAGLALLGGWALAEALRGGWARRAGALALAGIYLVSCVPQARAWTRWRFERSREVRKLVLGVARAHQLHRGKPIVLVGVWDDLFWAGVFDQPFRLFGANEVYLAPGSEALLEPKPEFGEISDYILPGKLALRALERDEIVVYHAGGARLRNATALYRELAQRLWAAEEPRRVTVGSRLYSGQLGDGWSDIEGRHRWMPQVATVHVGGPLRRGQHLRIEGYCPAGLLARGPARLTVSADGQPLGQADLRLGDARFQQEFPLPEAIVGRPSMSVRLELDRTFTPPGETRPLGLVFGTIRVR